ncbi:MAG TPA: BBP7 family outer membrane beta-barrel protein [Stellaceae bacterium]|nr:BBP7 family outer membrane beta-barrel protein [Stellaceae bacterium]
MSETKSILAAASFAVAGLLLANADVAPATAAEADPPAAVAGNSPLSVQLDYLIWNVSGDKLPALVSTGLLGAPGTQILYGNSTVNDDWRSGGQITARWLFDPSHNAGAEISFFDLGDASSRFSTDSSAHPNLDLPFIDATSGLPVAFLAGVPGAISGGVTVSDTSRFLGLRALYRRALGAMGKEHFSALIGYRFLYENDQLDISTSALQLSGPVAGTFVAQRSSFGATNSFHGLDVGIGGDIAEGPWRIAWRAQLALGASINDARIDGVTTGTFAGTTMTFAGGSFALPTNIGARSQAQFAVVPEFSLTAGYEFMPSWQLIAGFDVIYWTGVQRAGKLIDTTLNPNLIPPGNGLGGPQRPAARFDTGALLAEGFTLGVKHAF